MNTGQALSAVIKAELKGMTLNTTQQARLQAILKGAGGDFEPDDFDLAIFDVKLMVLDEKVDDLFALLKQCPLTGKSLDKMVYCTQLHDGTIIKDKGVFWDRDRDRDAIGYDRRREPNEPPLKRWVENDNTNLSNKPYSEMTEAEYRKTGFAGTRLGDIRGVQLFGAGYAVIKKGE